MSVKHNIGRAVLALALGSAVACNDATGPRTIPSIDATGAMAEMEPVTAVLDQEAFTSLEGAGLYFGSAEGTGFSPIRSLTKSLSAGRWDANAARSAVSATRLSASTIASTLGSTYVYDPETESYTVDANASDAPEAGVRIVLYAWDQLAGMPASPLTRVGYVDLTDESTASTNVLRVHLVRDLGNVVLADYTLSHSETSTGESFAITGTAGNGTTTLNFTLNGTVGGSLGAQHASFNFTISAPATGASVSAHTTVNEETGRAEVGISLGFDGHTLTFDLAATATGATGQVKFDGGLYAKYTASYDASTGTSVERFVKANGEPLTAQELEQLQQLFERALDVGGFWGGLLWPTYLFQ